MLLLLTGGEGWAQCAEPLTLTCREGLRLSVGEDCQLRLHPATILEGWADCLLDSNFVITVQDSLPDNGPVIDGPGRYVYTVRGQHDPQLADFRCTGWLIVTNDAPPVMDFSSRPLEKGCGLRFAADINRLPPEVSRCYTVAGRRGEVQPATLDGRLAAALRAGGGIPAIYDACGGEVEVCVTDVFVDAPLTACVDTLTLQRAFRARKIAGSPNTAPAFRAQTIHFVRPRMTQLQLQASVTYPTCSPGLIGLNPPPRTTDYPFFVTNTGPVALLPGSCDFAIDYLDSERQYDCGGRFTFIRSFRMQEPCGGGRDTLLTQVVRVGDFAGPGILPPTAPADPTILADSTRITYATNTDDCRAVIDLNRGARAFDECQSARLSAWLFPEGASPEPPLGPFLLGQGGTSGTTPPLAVGTYLLRLRAVDGCGNTTIEDFQIHIKDGTPPGLRCRPATVALAEDGTAPLQAAQVDGGSSDACTDLRLEVLRLSPAGEPLGQPAGALLFTCADAGAQPVRLVGTDAEGNKSSCTTTVEVTDRRPPTCQAPGLVRVNCSQFDDLFPEDDLVAAFAEDPEGVTARLEAAFGVAASTDNCDVESLTETIAGRLNSCGTGQIFRRFTARDASAFTTAGRCVQSIVVTSLADYSLRFPGDGETDCAALDFEPTDFLATGSGCELLATNTFRDTLSTASSSGCFALMVTHEVINWCEYDGRSAAFLLPRNSPDPRTPAQPLFLHILPRNAADFTDDRAILDRDARPGNGNELNELSPNYGTTAQRGYFRYQQRVTILDEVAPALTVFPPNNGLAFTEDCQGGVSLRLQTNDDCGLVDVVVAVDENAVDRNGDGTFDLADFRAEYTVPETRFEGDPTVSLEVPIRNLPIGMHLAQVAVTDFCGNVSREVVRLQVEDGRPPQPVCVNTVTVALVPDNIAGGINTVWVNDAIARPAVTCTETSLSYALYREAEAALPGFIPRPGAFNLEVDCADIGNTELRLYAFSENTGRADFCNLILNVTDPRDLCAGRRGQLAGVINDLNGRPMPRIEIFNQSDVLLTATTDANGFFHFDGLREATTYTIRPFFDGEPVNGISTADLNLIDRWLSGEEVLTTPYQLIAADANNNGTITVRDLVAIREVLLGVTNRFENNTSWRFLPTDYTFPDPGNPWAEDFPETLRFDPLGSSGFGEFTGIKVGDVTGNARPPLLRSPQDRDSAALALTLRPGVLPGEWELWRVQSGEVKGAAAGAKDRITAMQGGLRLPAGSRLLPGSWPAASYHLGADNVLRFSLLARELPPAGSGPLLRFALAEGTRPALAADLAGLPARAYTARGATRPLRLDYRPDRPVSTWRVFPSPFREQVTLQGDWPVAEDVVLRVTNLAGQVVLRRSLPARAGENRWTLQRAALPGAPGVYGCTLAGTTARQYLRIVVQ